MLSYIFYRVIRFICLVICNICFRVRLHGRENIPEEGPFIVASNHVSHLDPVIVAINMPQNLHFMAKDDLLKIRFLGTLLKMVGVFPVKRGYQDPGAVKTALRILKKGKMLMIFPEGGRVDVSNLGKPQMGIGMLAAHSGAPVLPVFIKGSNNALPKGARFFKLFTPIDVTIGRLLEFKSSLNTSNRKQHYAEFSDEVMRAISLLKGSYEAAG